MIRRWLGSLLALAAALAAALSVAPAGAQIELGATVSSSIALSIGTPTKLARLPGGTYEIRVPVAVTSTDNGARLSIADGENLKPPARGHLRDGSRVVAAPLEAAVAGGLAQPLSAPADPLLATWSQPVSLAPVTIVVRQSLPPSSTAIARVHKTLLITLSSQTP